MCASFRSSGVAFGGDAAAAALLPQHRCCSLQTRLRRLLSPVLSTAPCGSNGFLPELASSSSTPHALQRLPVCSFWFRLLLCRIRQMGGGGGEVSPLPRVCFLMWPTSRLTGDPIRFLQFS
ncbi:unnamed protein product [Sphagnum jensenii]|uniref:Uncharacterized protein n=1 Tax=Sphagnum jensenii TaxID=128206 RepID=A0ABP1AUP8_9BRYO